MSGSPPPPAPVPPHPGAVPPARRPAGLIALCAVLAVLLVAAVATIAVLLATDGSNGGDSEDRSAGDYASDACEGAAGLPEEVAQDDLAVDEPLIWELQSVAALAIAAGHADDEYTDHLDAGMEIFSGASRLDAEGLTEGLDDLNHACEENSG